MYSPCYKCEERHHGCHSTCLKYIKYSYIRRQNAEKIRSEDSADAERFSKMKERSVKYKQRYYADGRC